MVPARAMFCIAASGIRGGGGGGGKRIRTLDVFIKNLRRISLNKKDKLKKLS